MKTVIVVGYVGILFFCNITFTFSQCFITGADLSYVNSVESKGGTYQDVDGNAVDPYELFANEGAKMIRLRLWHTPENNTDFCGNPISNSNLDDVLVAAQKIKANGMQFKLSIHYSDYFTDPVKQLMPAAWLNLDNSILLDSIGEYTINVLNKLLAQNTVPDIVSVGNETTWGFIDETTNTNGWGWPNDAGKYNFAFLLIDNFNQVNNTNIKKAIHVTESSAIWLLELFEEKEITNFDIIGISYYPFFSPEKSLADIGQIVKQLTETYSKEVMIFETGFTWTTSSADNYNNFVGNNGNTLSYSTTAEGQKNFLLDLAEVVDENGGTGVLYWEPAWITSTLCDQWGQGSSYENVGFFNFNDNNKALPAFDFFDFCGTNRIEELTNHTAIANTFIFPNPAVSDESIQVKSNLNFSRWILYDVNGRQIEAGNFNSKGSKEIKFSKKMKGIYFLHLFATEKKEIIKKIVY
ncbi:MAG: glycosyl hydrolase 53 family protein [Saprospiraceae bacterium]